MTPTFAFDADQYFAGMRKAGVAITAEVESIARRVIGEENTGGDIYTMIINAIVSGFRAVSAFFGGGDSSQSFGDKLTAAIDNGQQRGDMNTAAEVAHRIRNKLVSNGVPADLAGIMTGDVSKYPEVAGNLYRVFSDQKGITQENRVAEAKYQQESDPELKAIAANNIRLAVADKATATPQNLPGATNSTLALT